MVSNLLKAGHEVGVFDIVPALLEKAVSAGAQASNSASDTVADVDVLISMLPASVHVESLYLGDDGILNSISSKTLVIDCSTIAPVSSQKVSAAAAEKNIENNHNIFLISLNHNLQPKYIVIHNYRKNTVRAIDILHYYLYFMIYNLSQNIF